MQIQGIETIDFAEEQKLSRAGRVKVGALGEGAKDFRKEIEMVRFMKVVAATVLCVTATSHAYAEGSHRSVNLAICLDTSGSMSGLIDSARQKIWQIVSELSTARPQPRLRVALLTYGSPDYSAETGYVRVNQDLTDDLDRVYEQLMALHTDGGDEYVARVVRYATRALSWDDSPSGLRIIFVAGNESADQDQSYTNIAVCETASYRDIVVNTIYCGNPDDGDARGYREVASLGKGRYASIDHNSGTVVICTPYDKELTRLSRELNGTYVAYGAGGAASAARQKAQDRNAMTVSPAAASERAVAKSSKLYTNSAWDLVDVVNEKKADLEEIAESELPEKMRHMTEKERAVYVAELSARRSAIHSEIRALSAKRNTYVKEEMSRRSLSEEDSFDAAVRSAVRSQAEEKGFAF